MTLREKLKEICGYTDLDDHQGAYNALINHIGYDRLRACIPMEDDEITEKYKKDPYLNNVPISRWDAWTGNFAYVTKYGTQEYKRYPSTVKDLMNKVGITCFSVSECVSLLKNTARMCAEKYKDA